MRSHIAGKGDDGGMRRAVGIAAYLEHAPVAQHGRQACERGHRLGPARLAHAARQLALCPPQRQVELVLRGEHWRRARARGGESRGGRRHGGTQQQEPRRVVRYATDRLRHQEILTRRRGRVRAEHSAARRLRGIDRGIPRDRETELSRARSRARCELGLRARATGDGPEPRQPRQETPPHQRFPP